MNYAYSEISFQEIPDEISVVVGFTGCPIHCSGCHSKELWDENYGKLMTPEKMENILYKYKGKCSCFCAMGGEWSPDELISYFKMARSMGYKTALYTGLSWITQDIFECLDYIKINPYIKSLGGLADKTTNQRMYRIEGGSMFDITSSFWKEI